MLSDSTIINQTQCWVKSVIVGLNFCPFAKREVELASVHYQVNHDNDMEQTLHSLIDECKRLDQHPEVATTLLIFADTYCQFDEYLDFLEYANALLSTQGYEGIYQLASFHPDYCFDGAEVSDAANYTNRSPYPMLHIIREASLEKVLQNYPEPESIPERNIDYARNKGLAKMKELLDECLELKE
jgi:hypothetical protein